MPTAYKLSMLQVNCILLINYKLALRKYNSKNNLYNNLGLDRKDIGFMSSVHNILLDWEFFSSPPRLDRLWGSLSLLSN